MIVPSSFDDLTVQTSGSKDMADGLRIKRKSVRSDEMTLLSKTA
jgi:hypothetical protein